MAILKERLYKTTLEIYTDYDPVAVEIDDLAREAVSGDAICEKRKCDRVPIDKAPQGVLSFLGIKEE